MLAQWFNAKGNSIRAWGRLDETASPIGEDMVQTDNMAIIDCLMNLPVLYWAGNETGNPKYREIAVRHADMALRQFIRPDDSVIHVYLFDPQTGQPLRPANHCGFSLKSYWACGAARGIYGFALTYTYTRDEKYRQAAVRLARQNAADSELVLSANQLLERIGREDYLDRNPQCPGILINGHGGRLGYSGWATIF